jgi:hypothetical protein
MWGGRGYLQRCGTNARKIPGLLGQELAAADGPSPARLPRSGVCNVMVVTAMYINFCVFHRINVVFFLTFICIAHFFVSEMILLPQICIAIKYISAALSGLDP